MLYKLRSAAVPLSSVIHENNKPTSSISSSSTSALGPGSISSHHGCKSLGDALGKKTIAADKHVSGMAKSPFGTEFSLAEDSKAFDSMDRELTSKMFEKAQLGEELSRFDSQCLSYLIIVSPSNVYFLFGFLCRLHQRGGKLLKERVRQQQVMY